MDIDELIQAEDEEVSRKWETLDATLKTEGWLMIEKALRDEMTRQTECLHSIPVLPENIPQLALAQSHIKGIKFIFDMIADMKLKKEKSFS